MTSKNEGKRQEKITVIAKPDVQELIPEFIVNRHKDCEKIDVALGSEDYESIRRMGHQMRGCGASLGFSALTEIGGNIEEGAVAHDQNAVLKALDCLRDYLDRIEVVYDQT